MEKITNSTSERRDREQREEAPEGWNAWDAVPRDGPAVFVVETDAFDQGQVRGEWLRLPNEPELQRAQLVQLATFTASGEYTVIDQVGLPRMVPEHFGTEDAAEVAAGTGEPT